MDNEYLNVLAYARFISKLKFLAYSNEVGETFRHTFPKLIAPAYILSFGYVASDTYLHCEKVYNNGDDEQFKSMLQNRFLWHSTASLLFPTLTIGGLIKSTKFLLVKNSVKVHYIRWILPIVGIGSIPFVIKPIDDFVDKHIMNQFDWRNIEKFIEHHD